MYGVWTDEELQHHLGAYYDINGKPTGMAAGFYQQLADSFAAMGVPTNKVTLQTWARSLISGNTTVDTYKKRILDIAKGLYPGIAEQLNQGLTVKDIADPYVSTMANLLEIDPGTIKWSTDPAIKRALQGQSLTATGDKVQKEVTPLWQFEQQVRQDPRWQYTQNATDTASTSLLHLGRDFGFAA